MRSTMAPYMDVNEKVQLNIEYAYSIIIKLRCI